MRAIDADELVKTLSEEAVHILKRAFSDYSTAEARGIAMAIDSIKKAPTIETVKYGEWEESPCFDYCFWVCTNCEFPSEAIAAPSLYKYCPNCGAIMTGIKPRKD